MTSVDSFKSAALIILAVILTAIPAPAGPRDPFPPGHSMASQGALVDAEGVSGRQPWTPAAYCLDSLRWGVAAAAVSYHGGGSATRYAVGVFGVFGPAAVKASLARLDVMGVYYEQAATLSVGGAWRFLSLSLDARLDREGVHGGGGRAGAARSTAAVGASAMARIGGKVGVDVSVDGFGAQVDGPPAPGAGPEPSVTARVCTLRNRYGSQGAAVRVAPESDAPVRFVLAQEYRIGPSFAFSASIASNPTTVGFGITVGKPPMSASAAAVNHPYLGWSKGVSADYAR